MKKHILLTVCVLSFSTMLFAQIDNELLGTGAGASITSGDRNVLLGDRAGTSLTSGSDNVYIGTDAGRNANGTINIDNVFIGAEAGFNNTASDNVFIGTEAGELNTTGIDNTFIGEEAGTDNTTGSNNVFIGEDAGTNNTTANNNTFIGSRSGNNNTEGFGNTYIGNDAGFDSSTGFKNTMVGDSTGIDNSIGRLNTFIGQGAGTRTENANYNTFIGNYSGGLNNGTGTTSGNRNTYLGVFAGYANNTGEDNAGVGAFADYRDGYDILNILGKDSAPGAINRSRTTFIGAQAFANNNDVIAIGYKARVNGQFGITLGNESIAGGTASVAIGQGVTVTQARTMALGGDTTLNRLSVGIGTVSANDRASLELGDTDKGLLLNRLTTGQRNAMPLNIVERGLLVYDTTLESIFTWNGSSWDAVGINTDEQDLSLSSDILSLSGSNATVDLSQYENTDSQSLSFASNILSLSGSSQTIDLSSFVSSDDQNLTSATLAATNVLTIEIEGGTSVTVDLNPLISDLEQENDNQQIQLNDLITRVTALEACACSTLTNDEFEDPGAASRSNAPILYQNIPNPYNGTTFIKYFIPDNYKKGAIVFSNTAGQVIDRVPLKELGEQQLYFNSQSLQAGLYYYTLFVDGRQFDTKKMIVM